MKTIILVLFMLNIPSFAADFTPTSSRVEAHALRLRPNEDPVLVLKNYVAQKKIRSASIASAVGSLTEAVIRFANQKEFTKLTGFREVVSLSGTIGEQSGHHIHMSVSDGKGATLGGHLGEGSKVYTTLEVVLLAYPEMEFIRKTDPTFGYDELSFK